MARWTLLLVLLFASSAFAGCFSDDEATAADTSEPVLMKDTPADPLVNYLRNVSEEIEGVDVLTSIVQNHKVEALDGVLLDTWIVRPDIPGPVPVVLQVTPYYAGGSPVRIAPEELSGTMLDRSGHRLGNLGEILVSHGFAYGIVSVRGTGYSEGCFTQGGPTEAKDTAAVIEHYASQDWSNGNVGLIGVSYPGTTPQDVWVEAPPSLKTIVPISGISDMYKYNFVNGVPINVQGFGFNTYYWAMVGAIPFYADAPNTQPTTDPTGFLRATATEACTDQVYVQEGGVSSTLDGNKDAYWMVRDFGWELNNAPDKERASVFYIHGLQDWNVKPHMMEDWLDQIQDSGVPYKVWVGQWTHNWPQREDWFNTTMIAWFDEFLKEVDTGILEAPPVQVQDDDGVWRHETHWPPRDAEPLILYPSEDGLLAKNDMGGGVVTYHDYMGGLAPRDADGDYLMDGGPDRVVWASEPVPENLTVSGLPVFKADVTASGARASLILTLVERTPDGQDRPINFAALSLNHADDLTQGRADISDLTQQIKVRFFPQDDVIHAGSRIVLIAAANTVGGPGPSLQPVSDGSDIRIDLSGAKLVLPIDMTRSVEEPQPCWEGQVDPETGDRVPGVCYRYPSLFPDE